MHSSAKPWELVLKYGEGGVVQVVADQAQVQVPALWAAVERCAAAELRSVNAQVECLLREALGARGVKLKAPAPRKRGRPPKETNE